MDGDDYKQSLAEARCHLVAEVVDVAASLDIAGCAFFLHPFVLLAKDFDGGSSGGLHGVGTGCTEGNGAARQRRDEGADGEGIHDERGNVHTACQISIDTAEEEEAQHGRGLVMSRVGGRRFRAADADVGRGSSELWGVQLTTFGIVNWHSIDHLL